MPEKKASITSKGNGSGLMSGLVNSLNNYNASMQSGQGSGSSGPTVTKQPYTGGTPTVTKQPYTGGTPTVTKQPYTGGTPTVTTQPYTSGTPSKTPYDNSGASGGTTQQLGTQPSRPLDDYYYSQEAMFKQNYNDARARGDAQGMRNANDGMNQVRNQYGLVAQLATNDINSVANQNANKPSAGGGYYGGGSSGQGGQSAEDNLYAQALAEQQRQYDEIQAQEKAAQQAAVDQAVGQLAGQKGGMQQQYDDLYRQLYLNRRMAEKSLPQQMSAMGYNGGLTESSALGLQTTYADALRQGEQAKVGTLSDIDRAMTDARLSGDIAIAQQAAQTSKDRLNSYSNTVAAIQNQWNQNRDFYYNQAQNDRLYNYQTGRDQVSDQQWQQAFDHSKDMDLQNLNRQQLLDEVSRGDVDYNRKLAAAQYLYENTGDASGLRILGYSDAQIAALKNAFWW